jgi:hypothetical protein
MALPATSVWEVRPTVGSDTNGGGFDSAAAGTDYSKQNSKNSAGSNISTTDLTTTTTGGFTCTSATASFTSAITGNFIYLSGGTGGTVTAGWYYATYATATTITLDRSPGAAATLVTMNIGGALATVSQAYTNSSSSHIIWVQNSGTYTVTTTLVISLQSYAAPGNPFSIIGYTTVRGDNGQFTWTTATNSIDLVDFGSGSTGAINVLLQNINFTTTAGTKKDAIGSGSTSTNSAIITLINCTITGFVIGIDGNTNTSYFNGLNIVNCRITGCSSHGVRNGTNTYFLGSCIDNNAGDGFNGGVTPFPAHLGSWIFDKSIFYKNSANGINFNFDDTPTPNTALYIVIISHCIFSTNTDAGALFENSNDPQPKFSNCIFDANGTYGIDAGNSTVTIPALLYNNAFYNNGTAATRTIGVGIGTITLTASPYVSIGTNFALNATSGGGALLRSLGWPGVLNFGGTGYASVGPLEVQSGVSTVPLSVSIQDPLWYGV